MMSMERVRLTHLTDVPAFYVRRIARIYPLLAVTVLVAVCFQTPVSPNKTWTDLTWRQIATNVVAVQNLTYDSNVLSVLWSLPLEVQMFALLPFMFLILRKSSGPGTVLGDMITRNHDRTHLSSAGIGRLSILAYIPCFLGGVLVYSLKPVVRPALPGYLLPVALGLSVWWYSGATQLWVTRQMAFLSTDLRTPAVLPRRRSSVDDSAGPTSREVLLWHLSCPHA